MSNTRAHLRRLEREWARIEYVAVHHLQTVPGVTLTLHPDQLAEMAKAGRRVLYQRCLYEGPVSVLVIPAGLLLRALAVFGWGHPDSNALVMSLWGRLCAANLIAFITGNPPARLMLTVAGTIP